MLKFLKWFIGLFSPYANSFERKVDKFFTSVKSTDSISGIQEDLLKLMQKNLIVVNVWMEKKYKGYVYLGKNARRKMYRDVLEIRKLFDEHCKSQSAKIVNIKQRLSRSKLTYPQGDQENAWVQDIIDKPSSGKSEIEHLYDPYTWDKPSMGELLFFHPGTDLKAVRAKCENAYDDVYLERTLALVGSVLFDLFLAQSEEEHLYDLAYHINGDGPDLSAVTSPAQFSSDRLGYREITNIVAGEFTENTAQMKYALNEGDNDQICVTMLNCSGNKVVQGTGPVDEGEGVPLHFVRNRAQQAVFASVISLKASNEPDVLVSAVEGLPDHVTGIEVRDPGSGAVKVLLVSKEPATLAYKGASSEGRVALFDGESGELIDAVE